MGSAYKAPPPFSDSKPYSRWIDEIKAWQCLTDLDESKQALAVALTFDEHDPSGIRDKVFSDLPLDTLKSDDGMKELIQYMDKLFKKDQLSEAYEVYTEFDRFRRQPDLKMETFGIRKTLQSHKKIQDGIAKFCT
ncbi:hypothetical protein SNE40_006584 [Patella caerulea]|uniref:Uncharacterized protein n=1 Tax=Patella caerulea TaxID=87958 RepID=A0AAN8JXV5_PATCE